MGEATVQEQERWADIVDLTNGLTNEDVAATFLLIQRGTALREQGYFEAAREALKEALRVSSLIVAVREPHGTSLRVIHSTKAGPGSGPW